MIPSLLKIRYREGHRTVALPVGPGGDSGLPERFRGRPALDPSRCPDGCAACAEVCPTGAISIEGGVTLDLGRCVFCQDCVAGCPEGAITYTREHRMAARSRADLILPDSFRLAGALDKKMRKMFGRSLRLRHVSAGDCSACSAELQALGNVVFDLARFGVQFVASPRHADGLIITGPVTDNMKSALQAAYQAVPEPRIVIAVGACAISGGPFRGSDSVHDGAEAVLPVDLHVPGCPPHPLTLLDGIVRLLGRIEEKRA